MTMAARNPIRMPAAGRKKARKPYTISRPRERWTSDEHDSFVHSLLLFGRDWKTIQQLVATKTATQIPSHAQKYFLKAQKLGLAGALPPPRPRLAAVLPQLSASASYLDVAAAGLAPLLAPIAGAQQRMEWTCAEKAPAGGASPRDAWFPDCLSHDDTIQLPLSSDDVRFAEVYRFIGDIFGSGEPRPVEAQLQRLHGIEPAVAETILLVLKNFEDHLSA